MIWTFIDGTTVHLGGRIDGDSPFARDLRESIADAVVQLGPIPSPTAPLDPSDPTLLDAWLGQRLVFSPDVARVSRPDGIPPLPPWEPEPGAPPDRVY